MQTINDTDMQFVVDMTPLECPALFYPDRLLVLVVPDIVPADIRVHVVRECEIEHEGGQHWATLPSDAAELFRS